MAGKKLCGEKLLLGDGRTLTCELEAGQAAHDEGVHRDGDHAWHYGVVLPDIKGVEHG